MGSDKHKAAEKNKIECLLPEWLRESVKRGYAVPNDAYKIVSPPNLQTSTPEKTSRRNDKFEMSNASMLSHIHSDNEQSINETMSSTLNGSIVSRSSAVSNAPYKTAYDMLDVRDAKKAGLFLDGCNVSWKTRACIISLSWRRSQISVAGLRLRFLCGRER